MGEWVDPEAGLQTVDVWIRHPGESDGVRHHAYREVRTVSVVDAGSGFLLLDFADGTAVGHPLAALMGWEVAA